MASNPCTITKAQRERADAIAKRAIESVESIGSARRLEQIQAQTQFPDPSALPRQPSVAFTPDVNAGEVG